MSQVRQQNTPSVEENRAVETLATFFRACSNVSIGLYISGEVRKDFRVPELSTTSSATFSTLPNNKLIILSNSYTLFFYSTVHIDELFDRSISFYSLIDHLYTV